MLAPGSSYSAVGRLYAIADSDPTPAVINEGFAFAADGSLLIDTDAPAGSSYNGGFRMNANGVVYGTTSTDVSDVYIQGVRVSVDGQVVYADDTSAPVAYANGNPFDADDTLAIDSSGVPGPALTFDLTTSHHWNGTNALYTGADPDNIIGGGAFGSFTPEDVSVYGLVAMYAYASTNNQGAQTTIVFQLSEGGAAAPSDAFASLSWTGPSGAVVLDRSAAADPDGADGGTFREWSWTVSSGAYIATGQTYTVTFQT